MKKNHVELFFLNTLLDYGDFISHREFDDACGLVYPRQSYLSQLKGQAEVERVIRAFDVLRFSTIEAVKSRLLIEENKLLLNVRGEGFQVVRPEDQTAESMHRGLAKARKIYDQAVKRITHTNVERLSLAKQAERYEALTKLSRLRGGLIEKPGLLDFLADINNNKPA